MSLSARTRLGSFEILESIGAGGMGEVYRARDNKLGRDVAIKILPSHLTADPERRARFDARSPTARHPQPPSHRRHLWAGRGRRPHRARPRAHRGRLRSPTASLADPCRSPTRSRLLARSPRRSKPHTIGGSSIAI